ncbi:wings apart-like protein regulation of heterochromatin-domain-containing protein [Phaeosphaeriaceae sp. PMI808]|nr:wings apart-like protein regulation of heterochromatin-domain-containing protein [Phaeosphaeriaceae sp. PMI808]
MSSVFIAPDRRKKAVTYGKSSRLSSVPTPATTIATAPNNDAPSSERPQKHPEVVLGSLKKAVAERKNGGALSKVRDTTDNPDIWDLPLEDEFIPHPAKTTKKLPIKRRVPEADRHAPTSVGKVPEADRQGRKAVEMQRKAELKRGASPAGIRQPKSVQPVKGAPTAALSSKNQVAVNTRLSKESMQETKFDSRSRKSSQHPPSKPKVVSRATTPILPTPKELKPTKSRPTHPAKNSIKHVTKKSDDIDPFEIPSSDDEDHMPTPKPPRRVPKSTNKNPADVTKKPLETLQRYSTESEDSEALKKRKRRGSVSSITAPRQGLEQNSGLSFPQRSRKYRKKRIVSHQGMTCITKLLRQLRTRTRIVPVLTQTSMLKGHSSPATLHNMLRERQELKPSPIAEMLLEDETMYEIQEMKTPVRPTPNPAPGSVTPRQKALFGSLLGTSSSSTTSMPSIGALQLTDRKPRSLLGALSRSKSDITWSAHARKASLITNLNPAHSSSDDEGSESESEDDSGGKVEEHTTSKNVMNKSSTNEPKSQHASEIVPKNIDIDAEVAADSQTSQTTSGFSNRPKFTYANARSYLQETNPEDNFLMAMDLDDPVSFRSQTRDSQTEEEEEASQVRANHELKRQGQNATFMWENEMLIDDISLKSSNSIRRSAILELCNKMMSETFAHELLNSSLAHQFLKNIASNGEIIFDVAAAVATIFMLRAGPTSTILDQVYRSDLMSFLVKLLENGNDIRKIAKNRATNLSRIAQDAVLTFRSTVLASTIWSPSNPDVLTPQLVALKALDALTLALRSSGSTESTISQDTIARLVEIASHTSERRTTGKKDAECNLVLGLIFSVLEMVSITRQKQAVWSAHILQRLAGSMPVSFQIGDVLTVTMAVKLCMNLTNHNPKACRHFSEPPFVQSLVQSIVDRLRLWLSGTEEAQRNELNDTLLLSLGAMLNLTEHSNLARVNIDDGKQLIDSLVETFVEGSGRSAQAFSMEETQSSVVIGYLGVLLGNMCLNQSIQTKIRARLPSQRLTILVDMIKEFIQVHEHANRKAKQFDGEEDRETWQNFTERIMLVVERLEQAEK